MPSDERGIFIKLYVDELRDLVQRCHLTRSEGFELVLLALRINAHNRCHPSSARCAADMGRSSRSNVSRIHNQLRRKGALDWTQDADKRTNVFILPGCFSFGSDVTQKSYTSDSKLSQSDSKLSQGGDSKLSQGGDSKLSQGGDSKLSHKQNTEEQESLEQQPDRTTEDSSSSWPLKKEDRVRDQLMVMRSLLDNGVDDREAYLMVQQFDNRTIERTVQLAQTKQLANKGGWIRSVLERQIGKKIKYPGQTAQEPQRKNHQGEGEEFHKAFTAAAAAARLISPYQRDYDRYAPKEEEEITT